MRLADLKKYDISRPENRIIASEVSMVCKYLYFRRHFYSSIYISFHRTAVTCTSQCTDSAKSLQYLYKEVYLMKVPFFGVFHKNIEKNTSFSDI